MVYTEYFVRGTEPTTFCELHQPRGILTKIADILGGQHPPAPPRVDVAAPPTPAGTSGTTASPGQTLERIVEPPPPARKRGFWSRVFGVGRHDDRDKSEPVPPKKKGGG
jgi:hypothetical protein